MANVAQSASRAWHYVLTVVKEYNHDHGPLMAAAMSFFATLSLFPLLLFGVSALGYFSGSQRAFHDVMAFFQQYAPGPVTELVRDTLATIVMARRKTLLVGVVVLLWTASVVFVNMETALSLVWDASRRPFLRSRLVAIAMVFLVGAGLVVSLSFTALTLRIEGLHLHFFGHTAPDLPAFWHLMGYVMPVLISIALFTAVYAIMPNRRVHFRAALVGGVVAGLFWQLALLGFRWYLKRFAHFDVVYGSLGGVVILVLWIYYSMVVLLFCAEIAWSADQALREREGKHGTTAEEKLSEPATLTG